MKNSYSKILLIALLTHLLLIFFGPYIVMNQLDRNIADAIANPYEGCEDTYDGIVGNLDQVCISRRSAARMPNYDFIYYMAIDKKNTNDRSMDWNCVSNNWFWTNFYLLISNLILLTCFYQLWLEHSS